MLYFSLEVILMPLSAARRRANAKWDKAHTTTVSVKLTNDLAADFAAACRQLGVTRGEVLRRAIRACIAQASEQKEGI